MNKEDILFLEDKLFEIYGQHKNYEECRKYILNIYETFNTKLDWFKLLDTNMKFDICNLTSIIVIQSERETLSDFTINRNSETIKTEYGIHRINDKILNLKNLFIDE